MCEVAWGGLKPLAGGIACCRVDIAEQVMGHAGHFFLGRPGRDHLHVFVDLHGIGIDDLAAKSPRHFDGEGGLAAGGRAVDQDHRMHERESRGLPAWRKGSYRHAASKRSVL